MRNQSGKKARQARYYQDNKEKIRAKNDSWRRANLERAREHCRNWWRNNPEYNRLHGAAYRASLSSAQVIQFTVEQLAERWAYYGGRCWVCGAVATATDHVKPLAKGGAHMLCNLRPICKPCNSSKGAKWPYRVPISNSLRESA